MFELKSMIAAGALSCVVGMQANQAYAAQVWNQDFEVDSAGWLDNDDYAGYGNIDQVASGGGTLGLTSASGSGHAEVQQVGDPGDESGPFSRFDGYRSVWPGGMTASIDIYLDTAWAAGEGFDFSVAANGSDGDHEQDFIFHVTQDTSSGNLLVAGSNNTNFDPREDLDTLANHYVVPATGWYTFEHVFRDLGDGTLAVDMNLRDSGGSLLFTETRNDASNILATVVGGNRYAWFTNVDIAGGIAIDNHTLEVVPEPASLALLGLGGLAMLRRRA